MNSIDKNTIWQIILILNINFRIIFSNIFKEIENCKITAHGSEYIGTISKSQNGKSCIPWKKSYIDQLHLSDSRYYDISAITDIVFCRNPTHFPNGPWCFIDKNTLEWEYCNIPSCVKERNWCKTTDEGTEYMGSINYTKRGIACKAWIDKGVYPNELFPEKSMFYAGNKCRNPENMQAPFCFYAYSWDFCNIPDCEKKFSQIEYFGGYDFLKSNLEFTRIIRLNDVYESMTVTVSVNIVSWQWDVRRKTSLWATDYDLKCQTDMNTYEYCQMYKNTKSYDQLVLTYLCRKPLRYLIFISPLRKAAFQITYSGPIYKPSIKLNTEFLKYQDKIRNFLNRKDKLVTKLTLTTGANNFFLLNDNVIPYAVSKENKVMVTISTFGKGCAALLPSHEFLFDKSEEVLNDYSNLADLFLQVFKSPDVIPEKLTVDLLNKLESDWKNNNDLSTPVLWNSYEFIGNHGAQLLVELIKAGLRIIIEIMAWEYPSNLMDSEIKIVFFALGIWPSVHDLYREINVIDKEEITTFPLVHMLSYAITSISNTIAVADTIKSILSQVPFQHLIHQNSYEHINNKIQLLYSTYLPIYKHLIPCLDKPVTDKSDKAIIGLLNAILLSTFGNKFIAPGLSFYPGDFQNDIQLLTVKMKLNLAAPREIYQLGLYAISGKEFSVKMTKTMSKQCTIHINFHLFTVENSDEWQKWPLTYINFYIYPHKLERFSFPFGGLIAIQCNDYEERIEIVFQGVVKVPYFDRRNDKNFDDWAKINNLVSPWVILGSDTLVFIVSSNAVRNLAEPDKILTLYDSVVKELYHIKNKLVANSYRMAISTDIQILKGYMHSRYPIATKIRDVTDPAGYYIFDKKSIESSYSWAILHEIGHNLQEDHFTFTGTEDVTSNIFTLVGMEFLTKQSSWSPSEGWVKYKNALRVMVSYLKFGYFLEWQSIPFLALGVYAQLRDNFGWEYYSQLIRRYNFQLDSNDDKWKINEWVLQSSYVSGMNLCPLFDMWRWPIEIMTCDKISHLPLFLPDDFLTKMVETRVTEIIDKYGGSKLVRRKPNKIQEIVGPVKNKLTVEGRKIIRKIEIINFIDL